MMPNPEVVPAPVPVAAVRICDVCGMPVESGAGRRKKELHEHCKNLRKYLAAAKREAESIAFNRQNRGAGASKLRSDALKIANLIPQELYLERGEGGRFVKKD